MGWFCLYRFLRAERFDIVFTQLFFADTVGRVLAFLARVPVVVTEIQNIIPRLPRTHRFINRALVRITTACISTTPAVTRYAREVAGFPPEKIREIPTNAVDAKRFAAPVDREAVRRSWGIPAKAKIILNIGRFVEQKGQRILIEAAPIVCEAFPDAYFIIVGGGRLEERLQEQARSLGVSDRVKFLGERTDTPALLKSADLFVFPSLWEGQGLILFEAIFAGAPIVASRTGGIPEVVEDGVTGILVPPGDASALAQAILNAFSDSERTARLARSARERFKDRTIDQSARKLEDCFRDLLTAK